MKKDTRVRIEYTLAEPLYGWVQEYLMSRYHQHAVVITDEGDVICPELYQLKVIEEN